MTELTKCDSCGTLIEEPAKPYRIALCDDQAMTLDEADLCKFCKENLADPFMDKLRGRPKKAK
jgi:hypothetical protein